MPFEQYVFLTHFAVSLVPIIRKNNVKNKKKIQKKIVKKYNNNNNRYLHWHINIYFLIFFW